MAEVWLAESVRLSALWLGAENGVDQLTWESVVGRPPDQQEAQPRLRMQREAGPLGDGSIYLERRVSLNQVDWILVPIMPSVEPKLTTVPNVGTVNDAVKTLSTLIFAKATEFYDAPRFAFGLVATHPTESIVQSNQELEVLLKNLTLNLDGTSDFLYQINRPRTSTTVAGLKINRLSRWMSQMISGVRIIVPAHGPVERRSDNQISATRVEIDISTAAERDIPLPSESRAALIEELARLATEQLATGDMR